MRTLKDAVARAEAAGVAIGTGDPDDANRAIGAPGSEWKSATEKKDPAATTGPSVEESPEPKRERRSNDASSFAEDLASRGLSPRVAAATQYALALCDDASADAAAPFDRGRDASGRARTNIISEVPTTGGDAFDMPAREQIPVSDEVLARRLAEELNTTGRKRRAPEPVFVPAPLSGPGGKGKTRTKGPKPRSTGRADSTSIGRVKHRPRTKKPRAPKAGREPEEFSEGLLRDDDAMDPETTPRSRASPEASGSLGSDSDDSDDVMDLISSDESSEDDEPIAKKGRPARRSSAAATKYKEDSDSDDDDDADEDGESEEEEEEEEKKKKKKKKRLVH